jgi:hypothetical protein
MDHDGETMEKHRDIQTIKVLLDNNWELGQPFFDLDIRWQITLAEWAAKLYLSKKPTWFTKWFKYKKITQEERGPSEYFVFCLLFFGMLRIWKEENQRGESTGRKRKRDNMTCICGQSDEVPVVLYDDLRLGASDQGVRRCKYGLRAGIFPLGLHLMTRRIPPNPTPMQARRPKPRLLFITKRN